jgi:hypothetical protein
LRDLYKQGLEAWDELRIILVMELCNDASVEFSIEYSIELQSIPRIVELKRSVWVSQISMMI